MAFQDVVELAKRAKQAAKALALLDTDTKNHLITAMADQLLKDQAIIIAANAKDLEAGRDNGLSTAMLDRLMLNSERIQAMSEGLRVIVALEDPIGDILQTRRPDNGLVIEKVRVPIGVIGIIYESRPNVTSDVAGLCLKSGNAVILKGGREALQSNQAILDSLHRALKHCGHSSDYVQLIAHTDREAVDVMLQQVDSIDLIIPRGGPGLIHMVAEKSKIPVLKHYQGICHIYVDDEADLAMAEKIVMNAKCQRPGVCNAVETVLVHKTIAPVFLPKMVEALQREKVVIKGCEQTRQIVGEAAVEVAQEEDWSTEYLDLIVSVKVVDDVCGAVAHIARYGSGHSDAIITANEDAAQLFLRSVDSATVYHNASTRFTDGGAFGMGAEMGISTDKLHARGPVGLEELTTYKYMIKGTGQVRG